MRRYLPFILIIGLFALAGLGLAATAPANTQQTNPQLDLEWYIAGLKGLGASKNAKLKLLPAQAKKILPVLEALVKAKILITEAPKTPSGANPGGQGGQFTPPDGTGAGPGSGGSGDDRRQAMQEQRRKQNEQIQKAIESIEKALKQLQRDYILNLDFDAAYYGLNTGSWQRGNGTGSGSGSRPDAGNGTADMTQIRKMMEQRSAATERLAKLNKAVVDMIRKLAKQAK